MPKSNLDLTPIACDGCYYYTVAQFAALVGLTRARVYSLVKKGNSIRKLHGINIGGKPLIDIRELNEFPFDVKKYRLEEDDL